MSQGKLRIRCHHKLAARFNGWDLESGGWGGDGAERKDRAGVLPRSRSRRGCGLFRFHFVPAWDRPRLGWLLRKNLFRRQQLFNRRCGKRKLVSQAWEAEKTRSMASLDWQNSGAREQERNSQSTAKTTPHEALGQAEPIGPA